MLLPIRLFLHFFLVVGSIERKYVGIIGHPTLFL